MSKTRVLMVIDNGLSIGGVQEIIMALVEELNQKINFDIIVTTDEPQYYDEEFKKYGDIYYIKRNKSYRSIKGIYHLFMDDFYICKKTINILKENTYDAIYCANLFSAAPFLKAAKKSGVAVRIVHSMVASASFIPWYSRIIYAKKRVRINKFSTLKLAISQQSANYLFGEKNNALVVKNPIKGFSSFFDLDYVPDKNGKIRILHLGFISDRKNALFSIDIIKDLLESNSNFQLIIAGHGDLDYIFKLKNKIKILDLQDNISLISNTVDIKEMFKNCEMVILPSKSEGIPLTILEAQAAGIPCFVSNNVENDVNCGLCELISIDRGSEIWSDKILHYLKFNGITRKKANMSEWQNKSICDEYFKWFMGEK